MEAIAQAHAISVVRIRREHESGNGLELGVSLVFADGLELGLEHGISNGLGWIGTLVGAKVGTWVPGGLSLMD